MNDKAGKRGYRKKARLRISVQITAIVLVILVIGSVASAIVLTTSLNEMTASSKKRVVSLIADRILDSLDYILDLTSDALNKQGVQIDSADFSEQLNEAVQSGSITPAQQSGDNLLKMMVDSGMYGLDVMYYALPPEAGASEKPVVVVSSNDKYIYSDVPDQVAELAEKNVKYKLFEDGIPEMGLEGPHLVTAIKLSGDTSSGSLWHFDFKPMGEIITGVDAFFDDEKQDVYLTLAAILGFSVLGLLIVSFIVLGYLVDRNIARPVDELSDAAEEVITGDLEVRVNIRKGEEFSALKKAFNSMISGLSTILERAAKGESTSQDLEIREPRIPSGKPRRRSSTLIEVTALFAALLIITGVLAVIVVNNSIGNLVKNSKQKLIETDAELTMSGHDLVRQITTSTMGSEEMSDMLAKFLKAFTDRDKEAANSLEIGLALDNLIEHNLFELVYLITPPIPGISDTSLVSASSDIEYTFTEPSSEILEMIDKGEDSWRYFEKGIPEIGFNEPYLVTTYYFQAEGFPAGVWTVDFRPVTEQMKSIDNFFNSKADKLNFIFGLTTGIAVLLTIVVVYFALGFLLRKKITDPIDELTRAAEQVMAGNLDVDVQVRPGEELENLKVAFNEMVKSFRDIIARSGGN